MEDLIDQLEEEFAKETNIRRQQDLGSLQDLAASLA
jgi:hypothetical protein